jgi:hypothetical protein
MEVRAEKSMILPGHRFEWGALGVAAGCRQLRASVPGRLTRRLSGTW